MAGFTKLFSSIVDSTIWRAKPAIKIVWVTMLAKADKHGFVAMSLPGLADASRVTIPECEEALQHFLDPDPYSRTKDFEGRRILEAEGGWILLNHGKYRKIQDEEEKRNATAERVRKFREKTSKKDVTQPVTNVTDVTPSNAIAEADTEADLETKKQKTSSPSVRPASREVEEMKQNLDLFETHIWKPYPKRKSRTGLPCGKGHKPDAIQKCLTVKRQWAISWPELQKTVEMYHKFPNIQEGNVQAVEVFFGEKGHWLECWQKVKQQQPQLLEEKA